MRWGERLARGGGQDGQSEGHCWQAVQPKDGAAQQAKDGAL